MCAGGGGRRREGGGREGGECVRVCVCACVCVYVCLFVRLLGICFLFADLPLLLLLMCIQLDAKTRLFGYQKCDVKCLIISC